VTEIHIRNNLTYSAAFQCTDKCFAYYYYRTSTAHEINVEKLKFFNSITYS